jgi:hypothetical protein
MAQVTIVYWRDIPAQLIAGRGRTAEKLELSPRFLQAIDRAAMRGGARDSDAYLAAWRRVPADGDLSTDLPTLAARIEQDYGQTRLDALALAGGHAETAA